MPSFVGLEVWTETAAGSGARVASFGPEALHTATLKQSLSGPESLTFTISRTHASAAQIVHGRVINPVWSDGVAVNEWRIADLQDQSGANDRGQLVVTCQPLYLDLARAPYFTFDSAGRPTFDFTATQLTATQWLAYVVTACQKAPLPYTVAVGTVDFTNTFDLSGDFAQALEVIRAIQQPGRAPGDFLFRRNGSTDYKLDLLTSRGSSATTVRVQPTRNLLENVRKRTLVNLATKLVPRGKQGCATRDLSQVIWKVASVDSGTTATLSDPYGGTGPVAFTDQLVNLYVARVASTFSSQIITASSTAHQITVASTAGWSAGDFVRFFRTSGSAGERVISLSHPTRVLSPASGGYGPVTKILDMPTGFGDTNLVSNPWMNTWSNSSNPPDSWGRSSVTGVTYSRESTTKKNGTYSQKIVAAGETAYANVRVYSPTATPYTTSGLRFAAHAWIYVEAVGDAFARYVRIRVMKPDLTVSYGDGDYLDPAGLVGEWTQLSVTNLDLSSATSGVVIAVEFLVDGGPNDTSLTAYVDSVGLGEADVPIEDVIYSGGIAMWQRANVLLGTVSSPIAGYSVQLADLERIDSSPWSSEPLTLGGNIEVVDTDLSDTTTQRVVEMEQDLLNPLVASIQLQTADPLLTATIAGQTGGSTVTASPVGVAPTAAPRRTVSDYGITDVYTRAEVDALLNALVLNGRPASSYTTAVGLKTAVGYGVQTEAWTSRTSNIAGNIYDVCYGSSLFVAVGAAGGMSTSPTGTTWTAQTSGFGATDINGVCYGNSVYVAVGDSGTLTSSSDAASWTSRTSGFGATNIWGVCHGNGVFVAVGEDGKISSSTDGTTWTGRTSGFGVGDTLRRVAYGNGLFVAVGFAGKVTTSPDGTTWTTQTAPSSILAMYAIAYGNGQFIGSGTDNALNGGAMLTLIGDRWSPRYLYDATLEGAMQSATYGSGRYWIGTSSGKIFQSLDGGATFAVMLSGFSAGNAVYGLAYGSETVVAVSTSGALRTLTLTA